MTYQDDIQATLEEALHSSECEFERPQEWDIFVIDRFYEEGLSLFVDPYFG